MGKRVSNIIARLSLAGGLTLAAAGVAQAQDKPPVVVRAEQCLRQKVDRVVADEPDVTAAANFLVGYACAEEVAGATRYLRNETYVQLFTSIAKITASSGAAKPAAGAAPSTAASAASAAASASAMLSLLKVDPETGDMHVTLPGAQAAQANSMLTQTSAAIGQFMPDNIPTPIRKLAGDLVLEAHEHHKAK